MEKFFLQTVIRLPEIPRLMFALSSLEEYDVLRRDIPQPGSSRVTLLIKLCDMIEFGIEPKPKDIELRMNRHLRHQAVVQLVEIMKRNVTNNHQEFNRWLNANRPASGNSRTALHHVTWSRMHDTMEFLLGEGCNPCSLTRSPNGDWGGHTFLDLMILQKNDDVAMHMMGLLEEWGHHEEIVELLKNRDASKHGYCFAFRYAFQNECVRTFKWIVEQIFDHEKNEGGKDISTIVKHGLRKNKMDVNSSSLVEDFLGLWPVAIKAVGSLPKSCVWNSVGNRMGKPHLCKAGDMMDFVNSKLKTYDM